jgi:hypothetical protein
LVYLAIFLASRKILTDVFWLLYFSPFLNQWFRVSVYCVAPKWNNHRTWISCDARCCVLYALICNVLFPRHRIWKWLLNKMCWCHSFVSSSSYFQILKLVTRLFYVMWTQVLEINNVKYKAFYFLTQWCLKLNVFRPKGVHFDNAIRRMYKEAYVHESRIKLVVTVWIIPVFLWLMWKFWFHSTTWTS